MFIFNFLIAAGMDKEDATAIRDALAGGSLNPDAMDTIKMARRIWVDARDSLDAQFDRVLQRPVASVIAGAIKTLASKERATVKKHATVQTKTLGRKPGRPKKQ